MDNKFQAVSADVTARERDKLQSVFPECFVEGKLDIEKLLNLCGEFEDRDFEKYKFEWKGKAECFRVMAQRSAGTLRPAVDESVDFDATKNLYIEGDNLEVLKLLQTSYYRKVKMIYIDPPYNTGNDFVYHDDFKDPIAHYKEVTSQATKSNPETMGRFHTAWLNMMYPRLRLAANLLRDDGVIFVSIDDNEVHNLRKLMDEVFGEENFVCQLVWQKKTGASDAKAIATITEYILVYSKSADALQSFTKNKDSYDLTRYKYEDEFVQERGPYYIDNLDRGGLSYSDSLNYGIECPDGTITFPNGRSEYENDGWIWKWSKKKIEWARENGFLEFRKSTSKQSGWAVCYKNYLHVDNENKPIERAAPHKNLITSVLNSNAAAVMKELFQTNNYFDYSKPVDLIKLLISFVSFGESDIILDFFSGSATTAHAVMQLNAEDGGNRRFIMVQLPEATDEKSEAYKAGYKNICEIGKERLRRAATQIHNAKCTIHNERAKGEKRDNYELCIMNYTLDTGFRVLKLDTSNLIAWDASPIPGHNLDTLFQRFDARDKTLKPDRSDLDIVFEVMLKMGIHLDYVVSEITVGSKKCYSIGPKAYEGIEDAVVLVCLEFGITPEDVIAMCDQAPAKIICAEEAFADSNVMSNAHYILQDRNIEMKLL